MDQPVWMHKNPTTAMNPRASVLLPLRSFRTLANHPINHKGTGQVPLRIPTVRAPATPWLPWLPQPPEHSAAPLRLPRPTQTAITPSLIRLRRPSEESGWLCRVCHSTASRGAFHSKPRMRQFCRRESSFRSVQFLNRGVTSLAPPQKP